MPARLAFTCCLCETEGHPASKPVNPFDHEPLAQHLPENWYILVMTCPELVLDERQQGVADEVGAMGRNPAYGVLAAQIRAMARHFNTTLVVCPACQVGAVFETFQRRLQKAVEVVETDCRNAGDRRSAPSALPPWLRMVEDDDEDAAEALWVTDIQEEVWRADRDAGDMETALARLAGRDPLLLETSGSSLLYEDHWVVHLRPITRICRLCDDTIPLPR
jgi:hypothetical protein